VACIGATARGDPERAGGLAFAGGFGGGTGAVSTAAEELPEKALDKISGRIRRTMTKAVTEQRVRAKKNFTPHLLQFNATICEPVFIGIPQREGTYPKA
jgi:hypothetical protein